MTAAVRDVLTAMARAVATLEAHVAPPDPTDLAGRLEALNLAGAAVSIAQGVIRVARVLACSEAAL